MTSEPQPDAPPPRLGLRTWAVGLLLLAAIFAAWEAHQLWFSPEARSPRPEAPTSATRPRVPPPRARTRPAAWLHTRPADTTQSQPASDLTDPWEDLDVQPLQEDPVGFPPPPGANGLRAYRVPDGSIVARYGCLGTPQAAAEHYRKALAEAGYRLLDDSAGEEGWRYLKFDLQGKRTIVALRPNLEDAKIVDIVVTLVRPPK